MKIRALACIVWIAGLSGSLPLAHAGTDKCTPGVLNQIQVQTIGSPQQTCREFTVVATAFDDCGLVVDYNAPATWSDLSATLSPQAPAPFMGGVSITHSANVGTAFQQDVISIVSGGVTGMSNPFYVHACGCSSGSSWSTADQFQDTAGKAAQAHDIAVGPHAVIAVGEATLSSGIPTWTVRRSTDRGATWETIDTFSLDATQESRALAVAADSHGNVYVVGAANQKSGNVSSPHWIVRKSPDEGVHWSTIQDAGPLTGAATVALDASGNVYVGGAFIGLLSGEWLIERSADGGANWTAVDTFSINKKVAVPLSIRVASTGQVIAAGQANDGTANHWIVRTSASGNASTWTTIQDYQLAPGFEASAHGVALDGHGNVVVVGSAKDSSGTLHWITQESALAPVAWSTIQDYTISTELAVAAGALFTPQGQLYVSGETAHGAGQAGIFMTMVRNAPSSSFVVSDSHQGLDPIGGARLALDAQGDLFVAGTDSDSTQGTSWFVRRLSCD